MCFSVINPCGYWSSRTSPALASNGNTLYSVMGVKRHSMPVDLPESESISGAEINLTVALYAMVSYVAIWLRANLC